LSIDIDVSRFFSKIFRFTIYLLVFFSTTHPGSCRKAASAVLAAAVTGATEVTALLRLTRLLLQQGPFIAIFGLETRFRKSPQIIIFTNEILPEMIWNK
jgi:hypothetical protein